MSKCLLWKRILKKSVQCVTSLPHSVGCPRQAQEKTGWQWRVDSSPNSPGLLGYKKVAHVLNLFSLFGQLPSTLRLFLFHRSTPPEHVSYTSMHAFIADVADFNILLLILVRFRLVNDVVLIYLLCGLPFRHIPWARGGFSVTEWSVKSHYCALSAAEYLPFS